MIIYERQPPNDILVRFGFEESPTAGTLRLCTDDGGFLDFEYRQLPDVAQPPDGERRDVAQFTVGYLWALLQARQKAWIAEHPHAEMTFV